MKTFVKTPDQSNLDFCVNWRTHNGIAPTETIAASAWTVADGLTRVGSSFTPDKTVIVVSGGTAGVTYALKNVITTSTGKTFAATFRIRVVAAISGGG
jgi:hypothetical protein